MRWNWGHLHVRQAPYPLHSHWHCSPAFFILQKEAWDSLSNWRVSNSCTGRLNLFLTRIIVQVSQHGKLGSAWQFFFLSLVSFSLIQVGASCLSIQCLCGFFQAKSTFTDFYAQTWVKARRQSACLPTHGPAPLVLVLTEHSKRPQNLPPRRRVAGCSAPGRDLHCKVPAEKICNAALGVAQKCLGQLRGWKQDK